MPFRIRPYRRFPVCYPVTYHAGHCKGSGTAWNVSLSGWRLSGDLPLRVGQTCSLFVPLSNPKRVAVVAGIVRWVRGPEYGIETLLANGTTQAHIVRYFRQQAPESMQIGA
jgi:PilZ domain